MGNSLVGILRVFPSGRTAPTVSRGFQLHYQSRVGVNSIAKSSMLKVHLKQYQFGAGVDVTGVVLCPVLAIVEYINLRGDQPGPFFLKPPTSFRMGVTTTAALAGIEDTTIQSLG